MIYRQDLGGRVASAFPTSTKRLPALEFWDKPLYGAGLWVWSRTQFIRSGIEYCNGIVIRIVKVFGTPQSIAAVFPRSKLGLKGLGRIELGTCRSWQP